VRPPEPLGPEDVAILRLESVRIAGHTCKVMTVDAAPGGRIGLDALRAHVSARLPRVPRMTERLSDDAQRPAWVPAERFDVADHVVAWPETRPATRAELFGIVAELMTGRLDRTRPLWSIHVVHLEGERAALVLRLHHCMADGTASMRLCSEVLWDPVAAPADAPADRPPAPPPAPAAPGLHLRACVRRELLPSGTDTPLDRHPSPGRRVAATRASLAALRRVGHEVGGGATVNDVVLCVVAGGLRRWLERHGGPLHGIRVKVPVSLHDHHERSNEMGNHDSFLVVDAGADEPDPAARLRAIATETRERKGQHDAESLDRVFADLRRFSERAARALAAWTASPRVFTVNVSNVPGPRMPVAVMSGPVSDLFSLGEIADRHALRVSAMSLGDELSFGLCADALAVDDPGTIAEGIDADLAALGAHLARG
jgi:Wax ester synthase/diacylglycerol acyltransferase catalytic domain/WS/DGAT C-terminal domain